MDTMSQRVMRTATRWASAPVVLGLLLAPTGARGAFLTGTQVTPTEWSYDLTFAPFDNYSIFQPTTTITLTGLSGVTNAAGPTSTDFPEGNLNTTNLNWIPQVLAGGTEVQWTHVGPGTGNFDTDKHVFGFRVFADGAVNGLVTVATSGISLDRPPPFNESFARDFTGTVAGPVVPEPSSLISTCLGLAGLAGYVRWGRLRGWPRLLANRGRGATRGREEPRRAWAISDPTSGSGGK